MCIKKGEEVTYSVTLNWTLAILRMNKLTIEYAR